MLGTTWVARPDRGSYLQEVTIMTESAPGVSLLGAILKLYRKAHGKGGKLLSFRAAAKQSGIPKSTWQALEVGERNPPRETILQLSLWWKVPAEDLLILAGIDSPLAIDHPIRTESLLGLARAICVPMDEMAERLGVDVRQSTDEEDLRERVDQIAEAFPQHAEKLRGLVDIAPDRANTMLTRLEDFLRDHLNQ